MGMGSFAVGSFVIEYDDLKKICPDEIKVLQKAKYFKEVGWRSVGQWLAWGDPDQIKDAFYDAILNDKSKPVIRLELSEDQIVEDIFQEYEKLVVALKNTFNKKTGLTLYFDSYDEDGGGRYDNPGDKDGCIFCVDGMVQLTPAGEKFKDIISERKWTQFG
jgi:SpoVK/Ycf46/Vps4 family AAA+-type ATPase